MSVALERRGLAFSAPRTMRTSPLLLGMSLLACSSAQSPQSTTPVTQTRTATAAAASVDAGASACPSTQGGMSIEGQLGTLAQPRVRAALREAESRLTACFTRRLETIPCLSGRVAFKIRVGEDGSVRWVMPTASTMGDRDTERCMQQELAHTDFGHPCGGEAEVTWSMELDGGPDARPATVWPASRLDALLRQRRAALTACRNGNPAALSVTLYAAPGATATTVASAGVSIPAPEAEEVADCVLREVRAWRLPSPGSWYARATVDIP